MISQLLSRIPSEAWQRKFYKLLMSTQQSFPVEMEHVSRDTVQSFLFMLQNGHRYVRPTVPSTGGSLDHVRSHFSRLGLLDEQVVFLRGFFSDTLPTAPIEKISVLRLDGDLYTSTMDPLVHLYPKLSKGGFCIVDDYYSFDECRQAIDEYRQKHGITDEMVRIDNVSVFWCKSTA
jgi:hypothetical protein